LTSRLCRRAVGVERPRARSLSPVGLVGGYVMAAHVSGTPSDRSSERARGRSTPGGPPCLSQDRLCAHGEGRRDELERLRAATIGLSAGRLFAGSASHIDHLSFCVHIHIFVLVCLCVNAFVGVCLWVGVRGCGFG